MGMTLFDSIMQGNMGDLYHIQNALIDDLAILCARQVQIVHPDRADTDALFDQQVEDARKDIKGALYEKGRLII